MNIKELADKIEKKANVTVTGLPVGMRFMTRDPSGNMVLFKAGEHWPIPERSEKGGNVMPSVVIALFQGDDEVRAYTLAAGEESATVTLAPPTRYTISKHQPSIFSEVMSLETFIDEIANEWVLVDEEMSSAERERAAVVEFLRKESDGMTMSSPGSMIARGLADLIEAEEHLVDDDEPEAVVPSVSPDPVI